MDGDTKDSGNIDHEARRKQAADNFYRLEAEVFGKVQGVAFRSFAAREALRYNLTGTVENEGGSSVSVIAEGPRAALQSFVSRLYVGPKEAEVTRIETRWSPAQGTFASFDIGG